MRMTSLLSCGAVALAATACVQSHRTPTAVYLTPAPPSTTVVVAPTSDREDVRVYSPTPVVVTPPSTPPPGVTASDVRLADSVSQLLKSNTSLGDATRNVEVTVDNGRVTLLGSVPTIHDRYEIVQRIRNLPGVSRVVDELGVEIR